VLVSISEIAERATDSARTGESNVTTNESATTSRTKPVSRVSPVHGAVMRTRSATQTPSIR
jgi:hypothetical protein